MPLRAKSFVKGDAITLSYQLKENGASKDISGMTFKFGAKEKIDDMQYKIEPVSGLIENSGEGKFSFTLTGAQTNIVFSGVYEITMYDSFLKKTTLTPSGGVPIKITENIID